MGKTTRLTNEEFIRRCNERFGNKFDYSKVDYKNGQTKVCIICHEHGEFFIRPYDFLNSTMGCPRCSHKECGIKSKKGKERFILEAKAIHGDKYDYSKVEYVNNETKVCIICPEHGEFWQTPYNHTGQKQGCPVCNGKKKLTKEVFIEKARAIHGDKYDYSKVEYVNNKTKVCIICPEHGEFWQRAGNHLNGQGCPVCGEAKRVKSTTFTKNVFIEKARKVHGDKYDYSKVEYVNSLIKICIICPEHGEFWQTPYLHLQGNGCPVCSKKKKHTTEEFVYLAKKVHNDKYDYSKAEYVNSKTKTCIICPEHGEFWQTPHSHLSGAGCPRCSTSKLENKIRDFLLTHNITHVQHTTKDILPFLDRQHVDFFLPEQKIVIECQGAQHFIPTDFGGRGFEAAEKHFKYVVENDKKKKKKCEDNNIRVLYYLENQSIFLNNDIYTIENTFVDLNDILDKIKP